MNNTHDVSRRTEPECIHSTINQFMNAGKEAKTHLIGPKASKIEYF